MADVTYVPWNGVLIVRPEQSGEPLVIAATRRAGRAGRVFVPPGRWPIAPPGTPHPDDATLHPGWIPVGPVEDRQGLYLVPVKAEADNELAIVDAAKYDRIFQILQDDQGGTLHALTDPVI